MDLLTIVIVGLGGLIPVLVDGGAENGAVDIWDDDGGTVLVAVLDETVNVSPKICSYWK